MLMDRFHSQCRHIPRYDEQPVMNNSVGTKAPSLRADSEQEYSMQFDSRFEKQLTKPAYEIVSKPCEG